MPRQPLPIAQGFYVDESIPVSAQQCVNFYPHIPQTKTITDAALVGVGGLTTACLTTINKFNRGAHVMLGIPYFVNGDGLYNVTYTTDAFGVRTYSATLVSGATLITGFSFVFMADNGTQLCIVAPDVSGQFNAWIYTVAGGLVQISDVDFDGPVSNVSYMDGYFIFAKANSNVFFVSGLRDGFSYNALDFASAESDPNPIQAIAPLNGLLYVFGAGTFGQYQDVGGAGFPFARATSGTQQKGCVAPLSLTQFNGSLLWIGGGVNEKASIWATNGGEPVKISTPAIDVLINTGGITPLASAYTVNWAEKGHNFIAFTIPGVCTVVYDATTQLWHERKSLDLFLLPIPWRVTSLIPAYSVLFVGDTLSGNVGILSDTTYQEYGVNMRSYFTTPAIDNSGNPFTVNAVELMMETGTVPISGQGSDPVVRMSISRDGGRTFSPEISRNMGLIGEYENRINWSLLGRYSRSVCFRFDIDEPIKRVVVKGEISIDS